MKKPHILLITIDSLRADHLSTYGHYRETSPFIDELAAESTIFRNAYSAANWTGASLTSILTGLYPTVHGYTNKRYYLDEDVVSLPDILGRNGYFTICFSNNMYLSPKTGLSRGFDRYLYRGRYEKEEIVESGNGKSGRLLKKIKKSFPKRAKSLIKDVLETGNEEKALRRDDGAFATERAFLKWLSNYQNEKPFFAHIHYQEPHSIYFPPRPYRKRFFTGNWIEESRYLEFDHMGYFAGHVEFSEEQVEHYKELYDGEIAYLDWRIGRLLRFIKEQKLMDDTVIIVTSDHGDNFGEKGYFWHAFCLLEPLIRVPLLVRYPEWFKANSWEEKIAQTVDIVPTLLEGIGLEWIYGEDKQGQSFLNGPVREAAMTETYNPEMMVDRWLVRRTDLRKEEFSQYLRDLRSYQTQTEKLVWASDGNCEYYNLENDPSESNNCYDRNNSRVQETENKMKHWFDTFKPHVAAGTHTGFDKTTWEKMRELGYA